MECESVRLKKDSSKGGTSCEHNGLITNMCLRRTIEWKDHQAVDLIFPFLAGSIDRETGLDREPPMIKVHTTYLYFIRCLTECRSDEQSDDTRLREMRDSIRY